MLINPQKVISVRRNVFQVQKHPARLTKMQKVDEIKNIPYFLPVVYIYIYISVSNFETSVRVSTMNADARAQSAFQMLTLIKYAHTHTYKYIYMYIYIYMTYTKGIGNSLGVISAWVHPPWRHYDMEAFSALLALCVGINRLPLLWWFHRCTLEQTFGKTVELLVIFICRCC